jgi:pyridoxal phosphate enzyme (YggS family)
VTDPVDLGARLAEVGDRIARAAGRVRRDPHTIRLVAVSKTFPAAAVRAAAAAGQLDFGENKVQEGLEKMGQIRDLPLRWHFIGHLQSNKARKAAASFDVVHSVDDAELVRRLDEGAASAGRRPDILIQVDLAGEPTRHGVRPDALRPIVDAALQCRAVRMTGLMVLPPATTDPEGARPYFARLARMRDDLAAGGVPAEHLVDLSMGMSHDFEIAIEEGATLVRVGSAIFGPRLLPARA